MAVTTNRLVNLQRQLFARSERVKGIDFHPTGTHLSLSLLIPSPHGNEMLTK
jgi:hypothetical protein